MIMQEERELIVEIGKQMSSSGLCPGTSGNQSIYNPELGLMAIKPSGIGYMETTPEDIVVMDLESHIVDGKRKKRKPSSEWDMHTEFYRNKPSCRAIVHTHSRFCTTFAVLGKPIEAVHYVLADANCYEVPCAPYHTFGTPELANDAVKYCGDGDAGTSRAPSAWPRTWSTSRSCSTAPCASASPTCSARRRWTRSLRASSPTASPEPRRPAIDPPKLGGSDE